MQGAKHMLSNSILKMSLFIVVSVLLLGCSQRLEAKKMGIDIPGDVEVTKIVQILNNPNNYNGKKVLLKGKVAKVCHSLCHFTYQEGRTSIDIYPKDFKLLGLKKGQKVKVYAEIKAGKERVIISALGIEVKER